ncbi:hypothetical protein [Winogradskyella flava]|uniref:Phospholipase D-like domain-containing protein n=1 Tax=Winogradskyella flava TaxID=1884876 RepID=A0A842IVQ5_9FLAO|nr:hypothetical protein [Winogradskyella flava]MBC2844908.1 hypothetical protein [Winogradskyella flava]
MSKFLTGNDLESKLTDIIWNAKKYVVIVSPFIKLDEHTKSVLDKIKDTPKIALYIIFGKNEDSTYNSFKEEDVTYFKSFKNIVILYNKNLHAKHYANESEGLITSLNLYGYSMLHNIEYGVYFSKTPLNPIDRLYEETYEYTHRLVYQLSDVVFLKKPQFSKSLFGLKKETLGARVIFDVTEEFFNSSRNYEKKSFDDFDVETETIIQKKYAVKPERSIAVNSNSAYKKNRINEVKSTVKIGYCIRTRVEIPYNPEQPMCLDAWKVWNQYRDHDFPEKYCHKTGKASYGKTSMANPILK